MLGRCDSERRFHFQRLLLTVEAWLEPLSHRSLLALSFNGLYTVNVDELRAHLREFAD